MSRLAEMQGGFFVESLQAKRDKDLEASFNNREIAGLFWLAAACGAFLIYDTRNGKLMSSISSFLRAALNYKLLTPVLILPSTSVLVALLYEALDLLSFNVVKAIFLWALVAGFGLLFKAIQDDKRVTKAAIGRLAVLTLVLEYIASYGRFSLPVELALMPILFFVGLMASVSSFTSPDDEDFKRLEMVERFFTVVLSLISIFLLSVGAVFLLFSPEAPSTRVVMAELSVPIVATIIALPMMLFLELWAWYESKLVRLRHSIADPNLQKYAFSSAMCSINVNRELADVWFRLIDEERPTSVEEIDKIMQSSIGIWLDFKTKRPINSPRATFVELRERLSAADWKFFPETGLRHRQVLSSHTKRWDTYPNQATIRLEIEGSNSLAETLTLRMTSWKTQGIEQDIEKFRQEVDDVLGLVSHSNFKHSLSSGEEISTNGLKIRLEHEENNNGIAPFSELELKIDLKDYDYSKVRVYNAPA